MEIIRGTKGSFQPRPCLHFSTSHGNTRTQVLSKTIVPPSRSVCFLRLFLPLLHYYFYNYLFLPRGRETRSSAASALHYLFGIRIFQQPTTTVLQPSTAFLHPTTRRSSEPTPSSLCRALSCQSLPASSFTLRAHTRYPTETTRLRQTPFFPLPPLVSQLHHPPEDAASDTRYAP